MVNYSLEWDILKWTQIRNKYQQNGISIDSTGNHKKPGNGRRMSDKRNRQTQIPGIYNIKTSHFRRRDQESSKTDQEFCQTTKFRDRQITSNNKKR